MVRERLCSKAPEAPREGVAGANNSMRGAAGDDLVVDGHDTGELGATYEAGTGLVRALLLGNDEFLRFGRRQYM